MNPGAEVAVELSVVTVVDGGGLPCVTSVVLAVVPVDGGGLPCVTSVVLAVVNPVDGGDVTRVMSAPVEVVPLVGTVVKRVVP